VNSVPLSWMQRRGVDIVTTIGNRIYSKHEGRIYFLGGMCRRGRKKDRCR